MAKQSTQTNWAIDNTRNRDLAISDDELAHNRQLRNDDQSRMQDTYNRAYGGYDNFMNGGLSPEDLARLRGEMPGSGHSGGGPSYESFNRDWSRYAPIEDRYRNALAGKTVDTDRLRAGFGTFEDMRNTGGFSNAQLGSMGESLGYLKGIGLTGGIDDLATNRMRGGGVFDEFAQTGGLSDRDKFLIRDRSTSVIPSMFDSQMREVNRLGRVSGNGGPAGARTALMSRMGRDNARAMSDASRAAELDITDRVNQGRQWGASSMSSAEGNLQGLKTGNMLQALQAALMFEQGMGQTLASNKMAGADALSRHEVPIQQMLIDEGRWGADNLRNFLSEQDAEAAAAVAGRNAAASSAWQNSLDNEWDIIDFMNQNKMFGTQGMHDLYDTTNANVHAYSDRVNQGRTIDGANTGQNIDQRMANNPHWTQQFGAVAGPIAAGASAFFPTGGRRTRRSGEV